jgi:glycosyltransferase involved in cell wall biosynthesis
MKFSLVLSSLAGGGAERSMLRLGSGLRGRGHEVRVIALDPKVQHEVPAGLEVHVVGARHGWLGTWLAARALRTLYRRLGLGTECLTISTLPFADQVAAAARVPNLWCRITNTLSAEIQQLAGHSPRKAARRLARYRRLYDGRSLVAVSDGVAEDLRTLGLQRSRIVRIYNGYDVEAIRAAAREPDADLPAGPFVLHVGRFMPQKRHDVLFDALKRAGLPHKLVLLAEPSAGLDRLIAEKQLEKQVLVAGFRRNPYPWMRAAEMLVLSSDREGMPNVLVEALICGTRVVSTDCPSGPSEILRGELARGLVPAGDAQALADAMRAALAAPRPDAGAVAAEFTQERMVSAYEALAAAA